MSVHWSSVTFLNSKRFLRYCSCPTIRDLIPVYPALFSVHVLLFVHLMLSGWLKLPNFQKLPQIQNGKLYFSPMFQKVALRILTFFPLWWHGDCGICTKRHSWALHILQSVVDWLYWSQTPACLCYAGIHYKMSVLTSDKFLAGANWQQVQQIVSFDDM